MQTQRWTNVAVPVALAAAMWSAQRPSFQWLDLLRSPDEVQASRQIQASWALFGEQGLYGAVAEKTKLSLLLKPRIQDSLNLDYFERQKLRLISWTMRREASQRSAAIDRLQDELTAANDAVAAPLYVDVQDRAMHIQGELERSCRASMSEVLSEAQWRRLRTFAQPMESPRERGDPRITRPSSIDRVASNSAPMGQGSM